MNRRDFFSTIKENFTSPVKQEMSNFTMTRRQFLPLAGAQILRSAKTIANPAGKFGLTSLGDIGSLLSKIGAWKENVLAGLMTLAPLTQQATKVTSPVASTVASPVAKFISKLETGAKARNLPVHVVKAIAKVEGGPAAHTLTNPLQLNMNYSKFTPGIGAMSHDQKQSIMIDQALDHMKTLFAKYKNRSLETRIQSYNGLGKLPTRKFLRAYKEFLPQKFQNARTRPRDIDMGKYKPYAKKVLSNIEQ